MYNQSDRCENNMNSCNNPSQNFCNNSNQFGMFQGCGMNDMGCTINGCPRPQPLIAPRRVCVTNQITPVPQPVICPIECRRVNRCMNYPVFFPQYEQTFMTIPFNQFY